MNPVEPCLWDELIRSDRKTLGITVRPDRTILIRAPLAATSEQIVARVLRRQRWIKRQLAYFDRFHPRTSERRFVSGEGHLYLGRLYRLKVMVGERAGVRLWAGYLEVRIGPTGGPSEVKRRVADWYRIQARRHFRDLVQQTIEAHFPGLDVGDVRIRTMSKRWGSCTPEGVLTLNVDLVRAPRACIEYVIAHELAHIRVPNHSKQFYQVLGRIIPDWRSRKDRLERMLS